MNFFVSKSPNRNWALRLGIVLRTLVVAALLVTITLPSAAILFALARLAFPVLYKVPLAPHILRPFTGHFLRGSWTLLLPLHHFPLLVRAWFLGCTTLLTWESADALFDAFIAQVCFIRTLKRPKSNASISLLQYPT